MNELAAARTRLHAGVTGVFAAERFHLYVPSQVVTPCGWMERARLTTRTEGRATTLVIATFPIVIAVDGADEKQQQALDDLVAAVWDAAGAVERSEPIIALPRAIDIGGPTTTGTQIDIDITITARTLCGLHITTPEEVA